jgi:hypothetical protein
LSTIDTLIGAGLTLLGFGASYLVEDRRSKRDVRLRSFGDRQAALNEVFGVLTECFFDIRSAINSPPKTIDQYNSRVVDSIRKLERTVYQRALWISTAWRPVANALQSFSKIAVAIQVRLPDMPDQMRPPLGSIPLDLKAFEDAYFTAGNAIGRALGIPSLENELRGIMNAPPIDGLGSPNDDNSTQVDKGALSLLSDG